MHTSFYKRYIRKDERSPDQEPRARIVDGSLPGLFRIARGSEAEFNQGPGSVSVSGSEYTEEGSQVIILPREFLEPETNLDQPAPQVPRRLPSTTRVGNIKQSDASGHCSRSVLSDVSEVSEVSEFSDESSRVVVLPRASIVDGDGDASWHKERNADDIQKSIPSTTEVPVAYAEELDKAYLENLRSTTKEPIRSRSCWGLVLLCVLLALVVAALAFFMLVGKGNDQMQNPATQDSVFRPPPQNHSSSGGGGKMNGQRSRILYF